MANTITRMKTVIHILCAIVIGVGLSYFITQRMIRPSSMNGEPIGRFERQYPGFFAGPMVNAQIAELPEGIYIKLGNQTVTEADVQKIVASATPQMRKQMTANMNAFVEQLAQNLLIEQELRDYASKEGIPESTPLKDIGQTYQADLIKKTEVNDADVEAFYNQQATQYGGKLPPLDILRDQIKQKLAQTAMVKKLTANINKQAASCEVNRSWVESVYGAMMKAPVVAAVEKLRFSGKPLVLVFAMNEAKMMSSVNQQMSELKAKYGDRAHGIVVPTYGPSFLMQRYRVHSFWETIVFNTKGREVYRTQGQIPTEELLKILQQAGM